MNEKRVPTVGENDAEMEYLFLRLCGLNVSPETVAAMLQAERNAPSSDLVGRPK
jgi:hypothetical protein